MQEAYEVIRAMDLNFEINNQILTRTDENILLVNKSRNYIQCNFSFQTSEWNGLNKFVIFKNEEGKAYEYWLGNSCECNCIIPSPVLSGDFFLISIYGGDRITTDEKRVVLIRSGYTSDISSITDEKDIFIQILEMIEGKADESELSVVAKTGKYTDLLNLPNLSNVAITGDFNDLSNKPTIISLGADVTLEQQAIADVGYFATYVLKQGGIAVGDKLQIPKDYLVKSVSIKECIVDDDPVPGYKVGDYYFDFVFNTKDSGETDTHEYLLANVLKDVYHADNVTLIENNNTFAVKTKGISPTYLSDDVNTKLGYAETFNSSPCKNITANDILNWNNKQDTTNIVTSWGSTLSDSKYPSEKLVKTYVDQVIGTIDDWLTR